MIYEAVKSILLFVMKGPADPPEPPAGSAASVQVFRASKQYLMFNLLLAVIAIGFFFLVSLMVALGLTLDSSSADEIRVLIWLVPAFLLFVGMLAYFLIRLEYDMRYYVITDRSLRIRSGVWTITEITLTYANVQHMEIRQGPIAQMLGIADLIVRTAGGAGAPNPQQPGQPAGHRGILRGIDNAAEIRDQINAILRKHKHAGLGDPEDRRKKGLAAPAKWSPAAIRRLREIRDELRAWRQGSPTGITPAPQ